jgi:signal recognition particle subunit SEC65
MVKEKKMSDKEWLNEYAKDMGYKFEHKVGSKHPYRLKSKEHTYVFATLHEAKNHVLRDLHRYIGDHTTIVDAHGNVLEMSHADKRKQKR